MALTTRSAPFVENAGQQGELFIGQPYELYSAENHATWANLYARLTPRWERYANRFYLEGLTALRLDPERIPRLSAINKFLTPRTAFVARGVGGYIPAPKFFDCLRRREFPATITIRPGDELDYLPEPDIFHDLAGHIPMHAHVEFANTFVRFGEVAFAAGDDPVALEKLARFFWFTFEFGLLREGGTVKACGSGLLSSYSELEHAIESPKVERRSFDLDEVMESAFSIDRFQTKLFVIESFDQLNSAIERL